jgi:hypothetical protein
MLITGLLTLLLNAIHFIVCVRFTIPFGWIHCLRRHISIRLRADTNLGNNMADSAEALRARMTCWGAAQVLHYPLV